MGVRTRSRTKELVTTLSLSLSLSLSFSLFSLPSYLFDRITMERIPSLRNALLILSMLVAGDMRFLLQELVEGERRITIKSSRKKMIIAMIIIFKKKTGYIHG